MHSPTNEVDHDQNPTKLFKRVEDRAWAPTLSRLEKNPNEAKVWVVKRAFDGTTTWKRLPIHQACIGKPTAKVILTLLQSYPNSARQVDSDRRLPIHHACANGASMDVIKHLLMAHPDSMKAEDVWFKTPLQTLLSKSNPDPGVVSALKKGPQFYRMKVSEARSRMNKKALPPSSHLKPSPSTSSQNRSNDKNGGMVVKYEKDRDMVVKLEEELGKFSERLAASVDQENVLKNRILQLENVNCEMERIQHENDRLRAELDRNQQDIHSMAPMKRELDMKSDHICRLEAENQDLKDDLNQYRKDLMNFDDVRNSEENLRRQLDNFNSGENNRIRELEDKLMNVSDALRDTESRLRNLDADNERNLHNLKRDLNNAIEDADASKRKANMYKEEQESMMRELDALRALANGQDEISNDLHKKLAMSKDEKDGIVKEMEQLDNHMFTMEKKIKELSEELSQVNEDLLRSEKEKEELKNSSKSMRKLQNEIEAKSERIGELEKKEIDSEKETKELKKVVREFEHRLSEQQREFEHRLSKQDMSFYLEHQSMSRQVDDIKEELQRAMKKKISTEEEHGEMEKKLKAQKRKNEELEVAMEVLKRRDKEVSFQVDKLNQSIDEKVGEYRQKWVQEQHEARRLNLANKDMEEENSQLQDQVTNLTRIKDDLVHKVYELQSELDNKEDDARTLCRETMSIAAEKDIMSLENEKLQETVSSLVEKLDSVGKENESLKQEVLENNVVKSELEQLHVTNEKLRNVMMEELEEKEELEGRVGLLMEEVERLQADQNIPKEISTGFQVGPSNSDHDKELYARIEELETNNESLRMLLRDQNELQRPKSSSSESMDDLEKRLNMLEASKDKEICVLTDEKMNLEKEIENLNLKLATREREIKELTASNQIYSNELKSLQSKSDSENTKKKKSLLDRLSALELRSGGSPPKSESPKRLRARSMERSFDDSSHVSGMTSLFSSTPSPQSLSPRRSQQPRSSSRSRYIMNELETRSVTFNTSGGKYEKSWMSKYHKPSRKKDLEGLFPSTMTISGLSLDGEHDLLRPQSANSKLSFNTSPALTSYSRTQKFNDLNMRSRPSMNSKLHFDRRDSSPSKRERILAILEE